MLYQTTTNGENTHFVKNNPMSFIFHKREKIKQNIPTEITTRHKSFVYIVLSSLNVWLLLYLISCHLVLFVYLLLKERKLRLQLTLKRLLRKLYNAGILWKQNLTLMDHYSTNDVSNATERQNTSTLMQVDGLHYETNALIVPLKSNKIKSLIIAGIQRATQSLMSGVFLFQRFVRNVRKGTKQTNTPKELQVLGEEQVGVENVLRSTRNNGK
jgi:hypothetical protein